MPIRSIWYRLADDGTGQPGLPIEVKTTTDTVTVTGLAPGTEIDINQGISETEPTWVRYVVLEDQSVAIAGTLWVGDYDDASVTVTVALATDADQCLVAAVPVGGGAEIVSDLLTIDATYNYAKTTLTGLAEDTEYSIELRSADGTVSGVPGWVRTRASTRRAFALTFSSCGERARNHPIYEKIWTDNPDSLAFLYLGDRGYFDISSNNEALFHEYDSAALSNSYWAICHRRPVIWMWDDHDFGANNAMATSAVRPAAVGWARKRAPIKPVLTGASDPIYRLFSPMAGVKVALLDIRSDRYSAAAIIGAAQEAWLLGVIQGLAADEVLLIATMVPWHSSSDTDTWYGGATIRQRIADAILQYAPGRVAALAGDAHMLAFADGSATPGNIPVCQAAPMGRTNSSKGGPWTVGPITATQQQYGRLEFEPVTGGWAVRFIGRSYDDTGVATQRINVTFNLLAPAPVVDRAPSFDGASTITGGTGEGATITVYPGPISGEPDPAVGYLWSLDDVVQEGQIGASFTRPAGVGTVPSVEITLDNGVDPDAVRVVTAPATTAAAAPGELSDGGAAAYQAAVLATAPQFLLMEAEGATIPDKSGNGRSASIVGTQSVFDSGSPFGLPVHKGGSACHIVVPHDEAFNSPSWSVAFFTNVMDSKGQFTSPFSRGEEQKFGYSVSNPDVIDNRFTQQNSLNVSSQISRVGWHFVVMTFDGATGEGKTYTAKELGGVALTHSRINAGSTWSTTEPIVFNGRSSLGVIDRRANIALAGMARWDRVLTAEEVSTIYGAARPEAAEVPAGGFGEFGTVKQVQMVPVPLNETVSAITVPTFDAPKPGNLLVLIGGPDKAKSPVNGPAGWHQFVTTTTSAGGHVGFMKIADGTETGPLTLSWSGALLAGLVLLEIEGPFTESVPHVPAIISTMAVQSSLPVGVGPTARPTKAPVLALAAVSRDSIDGRVYAPIWTDGFTMVVDQPATFSASMDVSAPCYWIALKVVGDQLPQQATFLGGNTQGLDESRLSLTLFA